MTDDARGVSTTLGYVMTLGITTLLITGLLVGVGGFVAGERERVVRSELRVVGQQMAADVEAGDRLLGAGDESFTIRSDYPDDVVGTSYRVTVVVDDPGNSPPRETYLELTTADPEVVVKVDMALQNGIEESSFSGGSLAVTYDPGTGRLEVDSDG